MKWTNRLIALLLSALMLLNLSACQPRNEAEKPQTTLPPQEEESSSEAPAAPESSNDEEEAETFPTSFATVEEMQSAFDEFIRDEFVSQLDGDYLSIHQMLRQPEKYGININEAEITLGDAISEEFIDEAREENRNAQERFATFDYELLTPKQQETYQVYEHQLNNALDSAKEEFVYMSGVFTPMQGLQNDIASFLMEFSFYDESDVRAYLEMMRDIPRYVEDHLDYTRKQAELGYFMPNVSAQETMTYCKKIVDAGMESALMASVLYNIENCAFLGDVQIQSYSKEAQQIFQSCILPAYQNIYDSISALIDPDNNQLGLCYFDNGKEYYEYLFRLKTGSSRSIDDTKLLLGQYLNGSIEEVSSIAAEHKLIYSSYFGERVHTDFQSFVKVLEALEAFCADNFPSIQPVNYTVNTLDPLVAVDGIGAYYVVPPLDDDMPQKIKINPLQNLEADGFYTLQVLAHEGFPGHLYQSNYVQQNVDDPFRKTLSLLGYSEGYATYVELIAANYLKELGLEDSEDFFFDENTVTLMQCYSLFENCLIALCDIGIHYDGWTEDDMLVFMQQYMEIDDAGAIYNQLLGDPGGFLSYYVGCVEFLELRRMAQEELGNRFREKEFHEAILQGGDLPFSVLTENVKDYINSKKA